VIIENGRAVGVEYRRPEGVQTARAKREVIVSGGVYGSPQLLMLSGLGPAEHLKKFGIAVVRDMPGVGSNLHDHFNTYVAYKCSQPVTMNDLVGNVPRQIWAGMRYAFGRTGPLASMGLFVGAFVRSDKRLERPDLQINMFAWAVKTRDRYGVTPQPFSAFTLSPVHLRPDGRGTVRLKSADPLAAPEIRFNFLKSASDWTAMLEGMRICREIGRQVAAEAVRRRGDPARARRQRGQGAARLRARNRRLQPAPRRHLPHGPRGGRRVDPQLKVYGIDGLRVADASVMPSIVAGNTNAPSIMIGEKCSDMVRAAARTGGV